MIEDITYSVFERFSIFQIIGKNPKINNFFFDEKSSKTFRVLKIFWTQNIVFVQGSSWNFPGLFSTDVRISKVGWWMICLAAAYSVSVLVHTWEFWNAGPQQYKNEALPVDY